MNMKFIGGILLIVGTAIGGGMLALPVATSQAGFIDSSILLFGCWLLMTAGALLILEVNLWLPRDSNLISMAKLTLGKPGQIVAWITCLLLLYSLLAAYIAGGGDFLRGMLQKAGLTISDRVSDTLFTIILGVVIYQGIRSVDYLNRGLMSIKLIAYLLLVVSIIPFVAVGKLETGHLKYLTTSVTVMVTSFGFANLVPSLRSYFDDDVKKLRLAILIGSLIPLVFYILWDLAVMGIIPSGGTIGLAAMGQSGHSTSEMANAISSTLHRDTVTVLVRTFTSICLLTSFLGVALCLSDFLADGLRITKQSRARILVSIATFAPPLLIALFYPGAFITALGYAGIDCVILLILLPSLMAWSGRYRKQLANGYQVVGGKVMLIVLMSASILIIAQSLIR